MNRARWHLNRRSLLLIAGAGTGSAFLGDANSAPDRTPATATPAASPDIGTPAATPAADETPIKVTIGEDVLTGRLWNNATAQGLITLLPLTLTFRDFNSVEKITRMPRELSIEGMPPGDDPVPGDIGYYAPTNDLVFYYGDVGYFTGIMRIGEFDGRFDVIEQHDNDFTATIELAE